MSTTSTQRLVRYPLYTISDLSTGIYATAPSILLMFYMTNILGIPVALATAASLLPRIVDLIAGPLIGTLSDRSRARLGRRRAFILFGGLTILPAFTLLWGTSHASPVVAASLVAVAFSVCAISFSCYVVPYSALNSEITVDYHDRTSLTSYRATYSMIGALLAGAGAPLIIQAFGGGKASYTVMGASMGAVMAVSILTTFFASREPARPAAEPRYTLAQLWAALAGNRPYLVLLSTYFLHVVASGLLGTALAYFVTYQLHREPDFLALVFFVTFGASILAIPLFNWVGKRTSKFFAYALATVVTMVFYTGYLLIDTATPTPQVMAVAFLAGLSEGGIQAFAFSMLIDCIRQGNRHAGAPLAEAMLSGLFLAGEKLGFAVGAAVAGGIFMIVGLVETTQGYAEQPDGAIQGIRMAASLVPAVLNLLSLAVFFLYLSFDRSTATPQPGPAGTAGTVAL